ncbi:MAG: LysR family transcriptional regulator [Alphaproteobacteria bacterium]
MNTLETMGLLVEAVDRGSFSAAGRTLGLTPSSVARGIAALEDDLGIRLLNRTTRKLSMTEAGRLYLERARRILADVEEARLSVTQLEADPRGTLRLSVAIAFGRRHIVPMVPEFLTQYPEVSIDLTLTDAFVDLVEEGIDLAIRVGELKDSSLIARRLAPNERTLCASPAYFDRMGRPASPDDLKAHNCLIYKRGNDRAVWHFRAPDGALQDVQASGDFQTNNTEALCEVTVAGQGVTILPTWLIGRDLAEGRLEEVLKDYTVSPTALDTSIYAVFPYNRHLSPKVRAFVDALVARFTPTPPWERAVYAG